MVDAILRGRMLRKQRILENAQGMENAKDKKNLGRLEMEHHSHDRTTQTGNTMEAKREENQGGGWPEVKENMH